MVNDLFRDDPPQIRVIRAEDRYVSPVLYGLLRDAPTSTLVWISERIGMARVPGLARENLITRLLNTLTDSQLQQLENELIAAHYGSLSVDELLEMILEQDAIERGKAGRARLDRCDPSEARLVEQKGRSWLYTMRGYDVLVDVDKCHVSCDCEFFKYAAHKGALCKHIATAFETIPKVYAKEALIDILLDRVYGEHGAHWRFESTHREIE